MLEKISELDDRVSKRFRLDNGDSKYWKLVIFFGHSGDSWFWLAGLLLTLIFAPAWRPLAAFLMAAILGLAGMVMLVKLVVRRSRPPGEWGAIYRNTDPHSFPSGHAARAAMLAVIAILTGPVWGAVLLSVWALAVGLARVMTGMHYLSDVVAGILLGIAAGQISVLIRPLLTALLPMLF